MKKVHRFILNIDLEAEITIDDQAVLHQWLAVLKFVPGELIELCDGRKQEAQYCLSTLDPKRASLKRVGEVQENSAESLAHVILYAAILKKEHFEWIAQKVTECGVAEIVPLLSERVVKKRVKGERLHDIVKEAAEQSGRGVVPTIHEPLSLKAAFAHAKMNQENYFFHVTHEVARFSSVKNQGARIGLFVGPEGGWTDAEAKLARVAGCEIVSLGPRVLRGETACILAMYLATK